MAPSSSQADKPWYKLVTFDLLLGIANTSIFHPFVCWMLPLCCRAVAIPYDSDAFRYTFGWALLMTILDVLAPISRRIAYGKDRKVDLNEEVIVITGGRSGLGKCVAEVYGLRGATVVVIDVQDAEAGDEVDGINYYTCDVSDGEAVKKTWAKITEEHGTPTILMNNAAIVHGKKFLDMTPEDAEKSFSTNTLSHYRLNSLFIPALLSQENGGTLITVSSVLAHLGASHLSAYTATKAALIAYHSSLSAELAASYPKIKTILVTPGQLSTDMFSGVEQGLFANFFGPVVDVNTLTIKLVRMIDGGRGGQLSEPAYARWIPWTGILPVGVQKLIRKYTGVDTAMLGFRGLGAAQAKENGTVSEKGH